MAFWNKMSIMYGLHKSRFYFLVFIKFYYFHLFIFVYVCNFLWCVHWFFQSCWKFAHEDQFCSSLVSGVSYWKLTYWKLQNFIDSWLIQKCHENNWDVIYTYVGLLLGKLNYLYNITFSPYFHIIYHIIAHF